jgi:hypothetical protein
MRQCTMLATPAIRPDTATPPRTGPPIPLELRDGMARLAQPRHLGSPVKDRVAGLLVMLYAQRIATITQLTADDIHDDGHTVTIVFGQVPVPLPEPLAILVRDLVTTRKGCNIITAPHAKPWLFRGKPPTTPSATTHSATGCNGSALTTDKTAPPPCSPWPPNSTRGR